MRWGGGSRSARLPPGPAARIRVCVDYCGGSGPHRGRPIAGDRCGFCGAVTAGDHVLRCMRGGWRQRAHTRLKHLAAEALRAGGAVVRLEPRPFAGSSARPDVEAVGSSGHPHYVDVGLAAAVSAATYEQQKEQPENDVLRGRFRRLRLARSVGRGVADEDGGPTRCTALR